MSFATGVLVGGVAWYALTRNAAQPVPTYEELCFLLSSNNQFSLEHTKIMCQLADACGNDVAKMMSIIEAPALAVAGRELSDQFPPAFLPKNTDFSIQIEYIDAAGKKVSSKLDLYKETGAETYATARAATIKDYTVLNIFPILRRMFSDCVQFKLNGYSAVEIFSKMSAPGYGLADPINVVVPNKVVVRAER